MWTAPVPFFEDEDEQAIIGEFVKLCALYPNENQLVIARHIFKDLRDPELRAGQAWQQWSNDFSIKVRIDKAKLNGGVEPKEIDSKEDKLRKLEAFYNNDDNKMQDRLAAMRLHSELKGEIVKAIEKKVEDNRQFRVPIINQGIYRDA